MTTNYRDRFGVLHLSEALVDQTQWVTIPDIAERIGVRTAEAGEMLDLLGLRWKGPNDRYTSKVPTAKAVQGDYVLEMDVGKDMDLTRWNFARIVELLHRTD